MHTNHTAINLSADNRLAISVDEATQQTGLGGSIIYQVMAEGRLPFVKLGSRRLIMVDDLGALLAAHRQTAAGEAA